MANPFKDAEKKKKVSPGGEHKRVEELPTDEVIPATTDNPLEGKIEQKQNGKPCGFYLSVEAIDKLEKLAKQNRCSKSKALDALLRSL